jgi:hypothetical protein
MKLAIEFDYKYSTRKVKDFDRLTASIPGIVGRRLMLRRPVEAGLA